MISPDEVSRRIEVCPIRVSKDLYPAGTWTFLEEILKTHPLPTVSITRESMDSKWILQETASDWLLFRMNRSVLFGSRRTEFDRYGVIGLGAVDLNCRELILTEGVSDYITAKLLFPDVNVLGFTKLGGTVLARSIVLSIADRVVICSDNDSEADRNTGMRNSTGIMNWLRDNDVMASIWLPECKDLSDTFLERVKI